MTWHWSPERGGVLWVPDVPGAWNLLPPVPPPSVPDSWRAAYSPSAVYPPVPEEWATVPPVTGEQLLLEQIARQWGLVQAVSLAVAVQQPAPDPAREQSLAGYFLPPRWLLHLAGLVLVAGLTAILILIAVRLS